MKRYSIKAASQLTGITPDTLRAWERRYSAVVPKREPQGRRFYTADDLTRLQLLKRGTELGHPIRNLAQLEDPMLKELVESTPSAAAAVVDPVEGVTERLLCAVHQHDLPAFERLLSWTAAALSPKTFVTEVVQPMLSTVGELWVAGKLSIAQEHAMTASLRNVIGSLIRVCPQPQKGPGILFTTPAGDLHEFGILLPYLIAASEGIRCHYLGPNLPPWEVARAAQFTESRAIAMSIVFAERPEEVAMQLQEIHRVLGGTVELWLGGNSAAAVLARSDGLPYVLFDDLDDFERRLELFRSAA